jgi:hypothetical protein
VDCEHHAVKRKGRFRCASCGAEYVIDIGGGCWIMPLQQPRKAAA